MYRVEDKTWYSIPKVFYTRIKKSELFCNDKVLLPTCQITADPRRLESTHPLEQSQLDTDYGKFAGKYLVIFINNLKSVKNDFI